MMRRLLSTTSLLLLLAIVATVQRPCALAAEADSKASLQRALDTYLDGRWLPKAEAEKATVDILQKLREAGRTVEQVEQMVRAGQADYGREMKLSGKMLQVTKKQGDKKVQHKLLLLDLQCEHVDYKTSFFLVIPKSYNPAKAAPLLLVGHGGNGAMHLEGPRGCINAALGGVIPWLPIIEQKGMVLAAPLSERGWGSVGNSILLSTISWVQKRFHVDPDRIYVTGHSMGGHLSWRSGIFMPDRWGAVSPMSGGYDYVENKQIFPLVDVHGYATFGSKEPYHINDFDKKIAGWMKEHDYDWKLVEKPGGHEIFNDELPKVADFLLAHPRNLYRSRVYGTCGMTVVYDVAETNKLWSQQHTWNPDRPIQRSTFHWLRMYPLPKDTPKEKSPEQVWAENLGGNRIKITSQFARRLRIYLHPKMVDFSKPIEVTANGRTVFKDCVAPKVRTMLELVREFDDRGRIFHASIDVDIPTDAAAMPEPRGEVAKAK
jgi:hypothetical protein